jgi:hypothetical protein
VFWGVGMLMANRSSPDPISPIAGIRGSGRVAAAGPQLSPRRDRPAQRSRTDVSEPSCSRRVRSSADRSSSSAFTNVVTPDARVAERDDRSHSDRPGSADHVARARTNRAHCPSSSVGSDTNGDSRRIGTRMPTSPPRSTCGS